MHKPLLQVEDLSLSFGPTKALDNVGFSMEEGEILGLVGESGSGKTTLGRCIMGLYRPDCGSILFRGHPLSGGARRRTQADRRAGAVCPIQMIFQDPMGSLDPRMTVGQSIAEGLVIRGIRDKKVLEEKVAQMLEQVGLHPACAHRYPHAFSGGQRQRIGIARALVMEPKLLIADEAVSALDVSVQAQVINLLLELRQQLGLGILFISHDLAVVKYLCDRVAVMHLGKIREIAPAEELFREPMHDYTRSLLSAIPVPDPVMQQKREILPYAPPLQENGRLRQVKPGHFLLCEEP